MSIEVRAGWLGRRKPQFPAAMHAELVAAITIPRDDEVMRLIEHAPDDVVIPVARGDRFIRVEIAPFAGRFLDARRRLYNTIVENLAPLGVPPADRGIRGGQAACDIDLGFEVEV